MTIRPRSLLATFLVTALGVLCAPAMARAQDSGPTKHVLVIPKSSSAAVVSTAQRLGLNAVVASAGTAVDVSGPGTLIARTFGESGHFGVLNRKAFGSSVRAVLDPTDTAKVFFPHASPLTSGQMIKDYGARQPVTGVATPRVASRPIVASIQLSKWNPVSLTEYARVNHIYADKKFDPVKSRLYANRPVFQRTGASSNCQNTDSRKRPVLDSSGQEEVVLDQEAILGAAPTLRQWTYTSANTSSCILSAYQSVLDDVRAGKPIVALTTSWGACESYLTDNGTNADLISVFNNTLGQLAEAGVTITAAAGDTGANDCLDAGTANANQPAVDFPASSPYVLGVGATEHVAGRADLAWNDGLVASGTGGGVSGSGITGTAFTGFAKPSWQYVNGTSGDRREVPDVAINGDPETGIIARLAGSICTDPRPDGLGQSKSPCAQVYGGSSLSAPLIAAALAQLVADHAGGAPAIGKGLVQPLLYAHPEAFTDVTDMTDPLHPVISAVGPGFDRASGLGVPQLPAVEAALFAPAPTITAPTVSPTSTIAIAVTAPAGITVNSWFVSASNQGCTGAGTSQAPSSMTLPDGNYLLTARALTSDGRCTDAGTARVIIDSTRPALRITSWKRTESSSTRLTAAFTVRETVGLKAVKYLVRRTDNHRAVAGGSVSIKARKITFTGQPGKRYEIDVTAFDVIGSGPVASALATLPVDDRQSTVIGPWTAAAVPGAYLGTVSQSSRAGASLRANVTGSVVGALLTKTPLGGQAALIVDGRQRKVIDLSSATTTVNVAVQIRVSPGKHVVQLRVLGAPGSLRRGSQVTVDGFLSS